MDQPEGAIVANSLHGMAKVGRLVAVLEGRPSRKHVSAGTALMEIRPCASRRMVPTAVELALATAHAR
jgi:hypothetical protein